MKQKETHFKPFPAGSAGFSIYLYEIAFVTAMYVPPHERLLPSSGIYESTMANR